MSAASLGNSQKRAKKLCFYQSLAPDTSDNTVALAIPTAGNKGQGKADDARELSLCEGNL